MRQGEKYIEQFQIEKAFNKIYSLCYRKKILATEIWDLY